MGKENLHAAGLELLRLPTGEVAAELLDEAATLALGARIARGLRPGMRVYVSGDLGSGKTTLARGLLRALGHEGKVKSPTFSLVELYQLSSLYLYHFDFYRFKNAEEWCDSGFRELFGSTGACLVEWPEKAARWLPSPDLSITLQHVGVGRRARLSGDSVQGKRCLDLIIQ